MPSLELSESVRLRPLAEPDAEELYALVDANRAFLAPWMPWAEKQTRDGTREFIRTTLAQERADDGFQVALTVDGEIAGVFGFHALDRENDRVAIGYWLAERYTGRGLATDAVRALTDHAFDEMRLHRVEIRVAVHNAPSRALCGQLGFVEEGVLRQAERFDDRYHDLVVYSMLAPDWRAAS